MTEQRLFVDFYHLSATPLERVLPRICEKLLEESEKVLVVAAMEQLGDLDNQLWSYARDSFLPHGMASSPGAAVQPVLVADQADPINDARNIILADGVWRDEAMTFDRVFYLFDARHLEGARSSWRALKGRQGAERRYWNQDDSGRWVTGP